MARQWTYDDAEYLRQRISAGATCEEVSVARKWSQQDIRDQAARMHLVFAPLVRTEFCPACAREVPWTEYDEEAGFCERCVSKLDAERRRLEDDELLALEDKLLDEGLTPEEVIAEIKAERKRRKARDVNCQKQRTKREREKKGTNPRKGLSRD